MQPLGPSRARGGGSQVALLKRASTLAHSAAVLLVSVCRLDGTFGCTIGLQLPPLLHLLLQVAAVGAAAWRTPQGAQVVVCSAAGIRVAVCGHPLADALLARRHLSAVCDQYAARHPANTQLVSAAYVTMQQVSTVLLPGTGGVFMWSADHSSPAQKCTAVAWSLQVRGSSTAGSAAVLFSGHADGLLHGSPTVHPCILPPLPPSLLPRQLSLGLVLATLVVWRGQLQAAERWASLAGEAAGDAEERACEFARSQYARVCRPALMGADVYGWPATVVLAALAGYVLGALSQRGGGNAP